MVFEDLNGNGEKDRWEKPIENVEVVAKQQGRRAFTDSNGSAFIEGVRPLYVTDIELNTDSLDDPLWIPSNKGFSYTPREGLIKDIVLPVVTGGEVDGTVYFASSLERDRKGVAGVPVVLTNLATGDSQKMTSEFDGFYLFPQLLPGKYKVEIEESFLKEQSYITRSPALIEIYKYGSIASNISFTLFPKGSVKPRKEFMSNIVFSSISTRDNAEKINSVLFALFPHLLKGADSSFVEQEDGRYQVLVENILSTHSHKLCSLLEGVGLFCKVNRVGG